MTHIRRISDFGAVLCEPENYDNLLANFFDSIKINVLDDFYKREESKFKNTIDFLNFRIYLETQRCLENKKDVNICKDQILIILFKKISIFIEEIERLNKILKEKQENQASIKDRVDFQNKLRELKKDFKLLECKYNTLSDSHIKMVAENEDLKNQNEFYCEQLKSQIESKSEKISQNDCNTKDSIKKSFIANYNGYEINLLTEATKDTNENIIEIENPSLTNIKNRNSKYSDDNRNNNICINSNDHSENIFNKECVEVNNININLNLHLKNSNKTNICLNNQSIHKDNKKKEVGKSSVGAGQTKPTYKTGVKSQFSTFLNNIKNNDPVIKHEIKGQHKNEVGSQVKKKNSFHDEKIIVNSNTKKIPNIHQKKQNNDVIKQTALSKNTDLTITNDDHSKVNISLTEAKQLDVVAIKNIALSYHNIFNSELEELNELERIIKNMTEEAKSKEDIREFRMLMQLFSKTNYPVSDSERYSLNNTNNKNQEKHYMSSNKQRQSFKLDTKQSRLKKSDENLDNTFIIHGSPIVKGSNSSLSDNYSTNNQINNL